MATTHSLRENVSSHLSSSMGVVGDNQLVVTGVSLIESDEVDDEDGLGHNCMLSGGSSSSTSSSTGGGGGATIEPLLSDAHFADYPFSRISLEEYSPLSLVDDCDTGGGDLIGDHGHHHHNHHSHHHHHHPLHHVSVDDVGVVIGDGARSMSPSMMPGGGGGGGGSAIGSNSNLPNQLLWSNSSTAITQNPAFLPFLLSHHHHHHYHQQFEPANTSTAHIGGLVHGHGSLFDSDQQLDQQHQQHQQMLINRPSSEPPPVLPSEGLELIIDRTTIDDDALTTTTTIITSTKTQTKRKDTQLIDGGGTTIDGIKKEAKQSKAQQKLIDRTTQESTANASSNTKKRTDAAHNHHQTDKVEDQTTTTTTTKRDHKRKSTQSSSSSVDRIDVAKKDAKRQRQQTTPTTTTTSARAKSRSRARSETSAAAASAIAAKSKADSTLNVAAAPSTETSSYHSSKVHLQLNHQQKLSELQQRLFGNSASFSSSSSSSPSTVTAAVSTTTTTTTNADTNQTPPPPVSTTSTDLNVPPVSVANILAQQLTTGEVSGAPAAAISGCCEEPNCHTTTTTTNTVQQQQPQIITNVKYSSGESNSTAATVGVQAPGGLAASAPTLAALLDAGPSRAISSGTGSSSSGGSSNSSNASDTSFSGGANRPSVPGNLIKKLVGSVGQDQATAVAVATTTGGHTIDFRRDNNGAELCLQPGTQFGLTNNGSLVTICTTNVGSYAIINPNVRITPATHCAMGDKRLKLENVTEVDGNIQTTFTLIEPQVLIVANGNEFQATKALLQNGGGSGGGGSDQLKQPPLSLQPAQTDLHQAKAVTTTTTTTTTSALSSQLVAVTNHGPSSCNLAGLQNQSQQQQQQLNMAGNTNKVDLAADGQANPKLSSKSISSGTGNRQVDPNQPFRCEHCNSTFTRLGNFTRHKKIHSAPTKDGQRFKCDVCSKSFLQRCDLARHLHIHRGTEPHRCNICGKGYIRHSDLVTHQRFHNKEKPFGCPHCSKGFCQRGDLNRHLRSIHLQMKPILCPCCNRKFAKQETLLRHLNTSHRS